MKAAVEYPEGEGKREVCTKSTAGVREYRNRTREMWERQMGRCAICLLPMRIEAATFDHANGRGLSGSKRDDRILVDGKWQNAALCWDCNMRKASRRIPYLIQQHVMFPKHFEELLGE
jgi:hypothetical protein